MIGAQMKNNSKKVSVAHVMFSLEPGGLENGVVNIGNGLDPDQFETIIVCLEGSGTFAGRLREGTEVVSLEKPPGLSLGTTKRLARWLRKNRPDVLHTHNLGPLVYAVSAKIMSFQNVPILHGEHGVLREEDLSKKRLMLRKLLYRFCSRVHTVSHSLSRYLVELGLPGKKISTVLNGVDCEKFRPPENQKAVRQFLDIPDTAMVVGIVGRFIDSKRHDILLEAFAVLGAENSEIFLLIVGDEGNRREKVIASIDSHPYRDRILWAGFQSDVLPYYQAMDLLIMPSSIEGLSNALLEGMACGVPGLAHPACGASEVIRDQENGWLEVMDSADDIVLAIRSLCEGRENLKQNGKRARRTAENGFSLSGMVNRYATLYCEIGSKGNPN